MINRKMLSRIGTMLLCVFLSLLLLASCSKETQPELVISTEELCFSSDGGTQSILITTNRDWKAISSASWVRIPVSSGCATSTKIKILVEDNKELEPRTATVSLLIDGQTANINIKQSEKKGVILSQNNFSLSEESQTIDVEISHNVDVSVTINEDSKSWISLLSTRSISSNRFSFSISSNNLSTSRLGIILVSGNDISEKIFISQTGQHINISSSDIYVNPAKSDYKLNILSSCDWLLSCDVNWINYSQSSGSKGDCELVIDIAENEEVNKRSGKIHFVNSDCGIDKVVTITQSAYIFYIDENNVNCGHGITIDGRIWAPVNCGYNKETAERGKYYQWGRKNGQTYNEYTVKDIWKGENGKEDPNTVYVYRADDNNSGAKYKNDWIINGDDTFWNLGTESDPKKNTNYDPCPSGWRVPTQTELVSLVKNSYYKSGEGGTWFSGSKEYSPELQEKVFLPAVGHRRNFYECSIENSGEYGFYWSSTIRTEWGHDGIVPEYLFFASTTRGSSYYATYRNTAQSIRCIHE